MADLADKVTDPEWVLSELSKEENWTKHYSEDPAKDGYGCRWVWKGPLVPPWEAAGYALERLKNERRS